MINSNMTFFKTKKKRLFQMVFHKGNSIPAADLAGGGRTPTPLWIRTPFVLF